MYKPVMYEIGSLAWLDARLKNITASDISSLFGLNKHKSSNAVIKDKREPQSIWSPWIRRGRILEPAVVQALEEDLAWETKLWDGIAFFKHKDYRLSATPDAKLYNSRGKVQALVECKSASEARLDDWNFNVPLHYALQVHVQMMCTGVKKAYIACLGAFDPFPLVVYQIKWDDRIAKLIGETVDRFWEAIDNEDTYKWDKEDKKRMKEWVLSKTKRIY